MPDFQKEAKVQAWIILGVPMILAIAGFFVGMFGPVTIPSALIFYGLYLFFKAKMNEKYRRKVFVSWGPRQMTSEETKDYILGYVFMSCGVVIAFWLAIKMS